MNGKGGSGMNSMPNEKARSIQQTVVLAMEFHYEASVIYLQNGQVLHFIGFIHYWNEETDEVRIINQFDDIVRIQLNEIVILYVLDNHV